MRCKTYQFRVIAFAHQTSTASRTAALDARLGLLEAVGHWVTLSGEHGCVRYGKRDEESEDRETHNCWKNGGVSHDAILPEIFLCWALLMDSSGLRLSCISRNVLTIYKWCVVQNVESSYPRCLVRL